MGFEFHLTMVDWPYYWWGDIVIGVPCNQNIGGTRPLLPIGIDAPVYRSDPVYPSVQNAKT